MIQELYHGDLSDDDIERLVAYRGGCSCHLAPPCHNHTDSITLDEAFVLGFVGGFELLTIEPAIESTDQSSLKNIDFDDEGI